MFWPVKPAVVQGHSRGGRGPGAPDHHAPPGLHHLAPRAPAHHRHGGAADRGPRDLPGRSRRALALAVTTQLAQVCKPGTPGCTIDPLVKTFLLHTL